MDISNVRRSVLMVTAVVFIILAVITGITVLMIKHNDMDFRSPVIIRKNPEVTYTVGEALYMKESSSEWKELEIGDKLGEGGAVKTGADGIVDLKFSDGTAMRITADSFLSLKDVSLTTIDVDLEKGRLISKFTKLFSNQHFSVKTPGAVAGIRGTELVFSVSDGATEIVGMSGITEVYNPLFPENKVLLGFQSKTEVSKDAPPADPEKLTPEEVELYRNMLDSIHFDRVIVFGKPIQFKPDTAEITPESRRELDKLARKMRWRRYKIEIQGHTADIGDFSSQYSLSLKRAETIRDYLISKKINPNRLIVKGYGGSKPIASNDTREGRARNRRVVFIIHK